MFLHYIHGEQKELDVYYLLEDSSNSFAWCVRIVVRIFRQQLQDAYSSIRTPGPDVSESSTSVDGEREFSGHDLDVVDFLFVSCLTAEKYNTQRFSDYFSDLIISIFR